MPKCSGLSGSEIATSGASGSQAVRPCVVSTIVMPWLPMTNSAVVGSITATCNPREIKNSFSLLARIGWLPDAKFALWFCERASKILVTRESPRRSSLEGRCCPTASASSKYRSKLKPRWDVHLSGDDDQLGCAGKSLSSVLGE